MAAEAEATREARAKVCLSFLARLLLPVRSSVSFLLSFSLSLLSLLIRALRVR